MVVPRVVALVPQPLNTPCAMNIFYGIKRVPEGFAFYSTDWNHDLQKKALLNGGALGSTRQRLPKHTFPMVKFRLFNLY